MKKNIAANYEFEITKVHQLFIEGNGGKFSLFTSLAIRRSPTGYLGYLLDDLGDVADGSNPHHEFNEKIIPSGHGTRHNWLTLIVDGVVICHDEDFKWTILKYVETLASKSLVNHFELALPHIYRNLSLTGSSYFINCSGAKKSHVLIARYV